MCQWVARGTYRLFDLNGVDMDAERRICEVCIEEEYVVVVYVLSGWLLLQDTFLATCQTL